MKVSLCTRSVDDSYQNLCEAWAVDLSVGGLGFMSEREFNVDDVLYISFEKLMGKPCYIPVHVKQCIPLIGTVYQVHGQFSYPDDEEEE